MTKQKPLSVLIHFRRQVQLGFAAPGVGGNRYYPPNDALLVDLTEHEERSVVDALKPGGYPQRIYEYLWIQQRIG